MNIDIASIGIGAVQRITDLWKTTSSDSLIDYTRGARVEPIALIDTACLFHEALPQVMQSLQSIFTGYYLQAIAISTTVGKVDVVRHLDKLNPSRNAADSAINTAEHAGGWLLAQESYKYKLPKPSDVQRIALEADMDPRDYQLRKDKLDLDYARFDFDQDNVLIKQHMDKEQAIARAAEVQKNYEFNKEKFGHDKAMAMAKKDLEERGLALNEKNFELNKKRYEDELKRSELGIGRDTLAAVKELTDLSVGKLITVEITDGLHKASIPISVRLMASSLPTDSLVHILSRASEDLSVKERWHGWRSGRLEFIRDIVLCRDIIDAHRKNLMADKDGVYTNILARKRNNQLSAILSANPSVATASNMAVLASNTVAELELKINGRLADFKTREKIFKDTSLMIMAVIDQSWDRVTFYHRGINHVTDLSLRDLKASNKGNGPDVSDILKAYQLGHAPTL